MIVSALGVKAQSRKNIANYSLVQQYFNPALTGIEGSRLKTLFRDQWTGFDQAPRTIFASGELDLNQLKWSKNRGSAESETEYRLASNGSHAFGLSLLLDQFGPLQQNQVNISYATGVRLSEKFSLRLGGALTYEASKLNPNKMTLDGENDPEYTDLMMSDNNQAKKLDANIGVVVAAEDYYLGYAMQDIARGQVISNNNILQNMYPRQHVVQAGYRQGITDQFGLVVNGIYRYDNKVKETVEGQLKGVFNNTFWAGAGYRHDLAFTFLGGVQLNQFRVGYVREMTSGKANGITSSTNELMFTYNLIPVKHEKQTRKITIW
jgi:type IX secretion system PorP/SprF family membrane protein